MPTKAASRELADLLRDAIDSGRYGPGERLPTERALAETHHVARNTVRSAIRYLSEAGLVTSVHGSGIYVREQARLMRFGQHRYSSKVRAETGLSPYRAEVVAQGRVPRVDCTSIARITPPEPIAKRLKLDPHHETAVRRENWYYADEEPVQIGVTWAPWSIVEGTPIADRANTGEGSIYARFMERGYVVATIREEVSARMPAPDEIAGLNLPDGVPVLDVLHTSFSSSGIPFEVTQFILRADRNGLDYTMKVDDTQ